jgi:phosphate starvation-inducible PhoH-like protein
VPLDENIRQIETGFDVTIRAATSDSRFWAEKSRLTADALGIFYAMAGRRCRSTKSSSA